MPDWDVATEVRRAIEHAAEDRAGAPCWCAFCGPAGADLEDKLIDALEAAVTPLIQEVHDAR